MSTSGTEARDVFRLSRSLVLIYVGSFLQLNAGMVVGYFFR